MLTKRALRRLAVICILWLCVVPRVSGQTGYSVQTGVIDQSAPGIARQAGGPALVISSNTEATGHRAVHAFSRTADTLNITAVKFTIPTISPSSESPDYWYNWDLYVKGSGTGTLSGFIYDNGLENDPAGLSTPVSIDIENLKSGVWTKVAELTAPWEALQGHHSLQLVVGEPNQVSVAPLDCTVTGFDPAVNAWHFPNTAASFPRAPDGLCLGMSYSAAAYYYFGYFGHGGLPYNGNEKRIVVNGTIAPIHLAVNVDTIVVDLFRLAYSYGPDDDALIGEANRIRAALQTGGQSGGPQPTVVTLRKTRKYPLASEGGSNGHDVAATGAFFCADAYDSDAPDATVFMRDLQLYNPNTNPPGTFDHLDVVTRDGQTSLNFPDYHFIAQCTTPWSTVIISLLAGYL
jgi:hypothetical protein